MTDRTDGGAAFPSPPTFVPAEGGVVAASHGSGGMTLRDWFAGQALNAMIATRLAGLRPDDLAPFARDSYLIADAMLAAREGK